MSFMLKSLVFYPNILLIIIGGCIVIIIYGGSHPHPQPPEPYYNYLPFLGLGVITLGVVNVIAEIRTQFNSKRSAEGG